MVTKFTRKELERIGRTEEEIDLVLKYQKRFPIILDNEDNIEKFCIDARMLYKEIIQSDDMSHFSRWMKRAIKNYGFAENIDFSMISPIGRIKEFAKGGDTKSKTYTLSVDMAKQLAMIDKKESGFIARRYFIIMEQIVSDNKEWLAVRDPEKVEYKKMSAEVDAWCFRIWHHHASRSEYAVEADMLNLIVSGKTSQQLKAEYGVASNDMIRDYLKKEHNEELLFLEQQNQVLLLMDMGFTERKNMLTKMHEVKFKNAINTAVA